MYFLLVMLLLVIIVATYKFLDEDFLSPTVISCVSFLFATLCSIIGMFSWNSQQISFKVVLYIILSLLFFGVGEFCARKISDNDNIKRKITQKIKCSKYMKKEKINKNNTYIKSNSNINIALWKNICVVIFIGITIILMFFELKRIAKNYGYTGNNVSVILSTYRHHSALFDENAAEKGNTINTMVSQMKKVCDVICIIMMYYIIKNLFEKESWKLFLKENLIPIISILLCVSLSLLSSGRAQLMKYIIAGVFMYAMLLLKHVDKKRFAIKFLKTGIATVSISILLFYLIIPLLGRSTKENPIDYISFYMGVSIPSFERYIQKPPKDTEHFGGETLYGVYSLLGKLKISDYKVKISREWRTFTNQKNGQKYRSNVYTSVRRYLNDYGVIGIIICSFIFGFVFYILYRLAKNKNYKFLIFYAFYSYMLIDQIRDELFFTRFIHINTIINTIIIIVLTWGIFDFDIDKIDLYKKRLIEKAKVVVGKEKNNENQK